MKPPALDDLALLPEPLALQRYFDGKNWKVFRWFLLLIGLAMVGGSANALQESEAVWLAYTATALALTVGLFVVRRKDWFERAFRQIVIGYFFVLMLGAKLFTPEVEDARQAGVNIVPFVLLFLRLRPAEALLLYGTSWVLKTFTFSPGGPPGWFAMDLRPDVTVSTLLFLICSLAWTRFERRRFTVDWRREGSRARERARMREEIGYARKIQLSMLPQNPPAADWLELAAFSNPATEVGGDYYDYFPLSPGRVVLAVGDVAGHGLASGLLLSGVRSCLYLLEDDLASPVAVLERLSPMVRRTTSKRMYVTLLLAVLDREAGTLTVASAGHPPLLRRAAGTGPCDDVGKGAPPLGTFKGARFEADIRPLLSGDLLVLYTDGLLEARDAAGREYGHERLQEALGRAGGQSVEKIRDAVLADLARFRGTEEQEDDVTLVVARMK